MDGTKRTLCQARLREAKELNDVLKFSPLVMVSDLPTLVAKVKGLSSIVGKLIKVCESLTDDADSKQRFNGMD